MTPHHEMNINSLVLRDLKATYVLTPHHEMDLDILVLHDLKATYVLTRDRREHKNYISRIKSLENLVTEPKLNGRRELVSTKETISYRGAKSFFLYFSENN